MNTLILRRTSRSGSSQSTSRSESSQSRTGSKCSNEIQRRSSTKKAWTRPGERRDQRRSVTVSVRGIAARITSLSAPRIPSLRRVCRAWDWHRNRDPLRLWLERWNSNTAAATDGRARELAARQPVIAIPRIFALPHPRGSLEYLLLGLLRLLFRRYANSIRARRRERWNPRGGHEELARSRPPPKKHEHRKESGDRDSCPNKHFFTPARS